MTRYDPAFAPRSTTMKGVMLNSVSAPALLSHGVEVVPAPVTMDDLRGMVDRTFDAVVAGVDVGSGDIVVTRTAAS